MRAAVLTEVNKPLQILDLEQEGPKAGEVRVQVKAAGVCMSDWHIMNGDWPLPLPMVLGHEAAGIVVELGPGVSNVKKGDHVIFSFRPNCGHCRYCSKGRIVLCNGHNDTPRWRMHDGTRAREAQRRAGEPDGAHRHVLGIRRCARPSRWCRCARTCRGRTRPSSAAAWRPASAPSSGTPRWRRARACWWSAAAASASTWCRAPSWPARRTIIACDLLDNKLGYAREFGATHTINAKKDDIVKRVKELTGGLGVDYAFDAIGGAKTIGRLRRCASRRAAMPCMVGMPAFTDRAQVNPFQMVLQREEDHRHLLRLDPAADRLRRAGRPRHGQAHQPR